MSGAASPEAGRAPFDAGPLTAAEYHRLLESRDGLVLRVSDGDPDGTYRFWVADGQLYWRCLNWGSDQQSPLANLRAVLDDDVTTQLLIERDGEGE